MKNLEKLLAGACALALAACDTGVSGTQSPAPPAESVVIEEIRAIPVAANEAAPAPDANPATDTALPPADAMPGNPAKPAAVTPATRPPHWAEPIELAGAPNLHRITPWLYRSEQPTAEGMKNLEKLGIRTVINLRAFHDDAEAVKGTKLRRERLKILTWDVDDKHVIEVLRILREPANGPYLIHCKHGADRTGLMSAMYRILEQGWSKEDALREMMDGEYGYHTVWKNIVRYVRESDLDALRGSIASTGSTSTVTDN
jgi:protein tyrosine phosphatase (PTP) superfamily phosphohydrolase (DUF442 family)